MDLSCQLKESLVMKHPDGKQNHRQWGRTGLISVLAWNAFFWRCSRLSCNLFADMCRLAKRHYTLDFYTAACPTDNRMYVKTVFTCAVCTIDSACFGHIFSSIHCKLGLPSMMQTEQRLIYFSYNNHNMITIFEYFIIDCDQSLNITVDTVFIMWNLLSLKTLWCILSG